MKKKGRTYIFVLFFSFFALSLSLSSVFAFAHGEVPSGTFVVRPAKTEVTMLPGEEKLLTFNVANGTLAPLLIRVHGEDVAPVKQAQIHDAPVELLGDKNGQFSLKEFLDIKEKEIRLLSGESAKVSVQIRIPERASPGGRYGSVVFTATGGITPGVIATTNIATENRIATMLYVRVDGEIKEEGKLFTFGIFNNAKKIPSPTVDAPLHFQVAYENTGSVHLNPYGQVTVSGMFGEASPVIIEPWAVLPSALRMHEVDFVSSLFPGYYKAKLELNRGYGDIIDEMSVSFWVLPGFGGWLMIIGVVLLFGWVVFKSIRISRNKLSK